jgi:hypothetical protein
VVRVIDIEVGIAELGYCPRGGRPSITDG